MGLWDSTYTPEVVHWTPRTCRKWKTPCAAWGLTGSWMIGAGGITTCLMRWIVSTNSPDETEYACNMETQQCDPVHWGTGVHKDECSCDWGFDCYITRSWLLCVNSVIQVMHKWLKVCIPLCFKVQSVCRMLWCLSDWRYIVSYFSLFIMISHLFVARRSIYSFWILELFYFII